MTKDIDLKDKLIPFSRRNIVSDNPAEMDNEIEKFFGNYLNNRSESSQNRQLELYDDDFRALENETYFKKRFGFAYGRRGRLAVFDLIYTYDLTNDEVRSLYRIGLLNWDGNKLRVTSNWTSRFTMVFWYFYLIFILLLTGLVAHALLATQPIVNFKQSGILWILFGALTLLTSWIHIRFLRPFKVLKNRQTAQNTNTKKTEEETE